MHIHQVAHVSDECISSAPFLFLSTAGKTLPEFNFHLAFLTQWKGKCNRVLIVAWSIVRDRSRAAATSKIECFVIIVSGWKPLTITTKHSILDVAAALDPPLHCAIFMFKCSIIFIADVISITWFHLKYLSTISWPLLSLRIDLVIEVTFSQNRHNLFSKYLWKMVQFFLLRKR